MLCRNPFLRGMQAFPCGRCMPCLFNRRRTWSHRIMLESYQHPHNAFVTLTYGDDQLPLNSDGITVSRLTSADFDTSTVIPTGTLIPQHVQNWLKRLRKRIELTATASKLSEEEKETTRIRFYLVGEYGEQGQRPHYHAVLFNFPTCFRGRTRRKLPSKRPIWRGCCIPCEMVGETWGHGDVDLGELAVNSAQYVAGYVTKKMTTFDDPRLLRGQHPEFARMSNRDGIGKSAMWDIASVMLQLNLEARKDDVPSSLRSGSRLMPLGRYLRNNLRRMIGREEGATPEVIAELEAEVRDVYRVAIQAAKNGHDKISTKEVLSALSDQVVKSMEARRAIYKERKSL